MNASEPLPHFVDDLLGYLYETHPTHANFDGVHTHDDLLENLSRHGIDSDVHALAGYLRRLENIKPDGLTDTEKLEHRMLGDCLRGRMFELEVVRTWERNPQYYADILVEDGAVVGEPPVRHGVRIRDRAPLLSTQPTPWKGRQDEPRQIRFSPMH
jgi:hypothetical protein